MTAPQSGRGYSVHQTNNGSGNLIGGHMFGNIEMLDARTKADLAVVSKHTPQMVALLDEALAEGLISTETARELARVARHVNEDTAHWIWEGGRGINEDTAHWIWEGGRGINEDVAHDLAEAGRNINQEVANRFSRVADEINEAAGRFEVLIGQLSGSASRLQSIKADAHEWQETAALISTSADELAMANQAYSLSQDAFSKKWFLNGIVTGVVLAIMLAILVVVIMTKSK